MNEETNFNEPALMKLDTACRYLDIGKSKLYELIRAGQIESVSIGKLARVTTASLKRYIEGLPNAPRPKPRQFTPKGGE